MKTIVPANPSILKWAREDLGFSLEQVVEMSKINNFTSKKLVDIEEGKLPISYNVLKSLSKLYQQPEIVFFLSKPPKVDKIIADFRKLPILSGENKKPELNALLRRISDTQRTVKEILKSEKYRIEFSQLNYLPRTTKELATEIEKLIGESAYKETKDETTLFKTLRLRIESKGIFVCLIGNLANHWTNIPVSIFRGIAIQDNLAPFIVINSNDSKRAYIFTLIHELGHLFIGDNADNTEALCNATAAEYLMPEKDFKEQCPNKVLSKSTLFSLFKRYKVSYEAIINRARNFNYTINEDCLALINSTNLNNNRKSRPDANKVKAYQLGNRLLSIFSNAVADGVIDIVDASNAVGLSVDRFYKVQKYVHT